MHTNLLLGNGINMHLGIKELLLDKISIRFKNILVSSSSLYECLFGVSLTPTLCDSLFSNAPNLGIETLSAEVYKYIYAHMKDQQSINSEYRLLNSIKTSAINAIFYDNEKTIPIPSFNCVSIEKIKNYRSIYTLNYTEFWDTENICTYLHGAYKFKTIISNKPILLYSSEQYYLSTYKATVNALSCKYTMFPFYNCNIVFSPLLDKQNILGIGHYPSKNLYPADDLFPYNPPKLYMELSSLSSLDVFGMSPFGDDKLINYLANIPNLTIYVYRMDAAQVSEWNMKLKRKCCKDSSLFEQ